MEDYNETMIRKSVILFFALCIFTGMTGVFFSCKAKTPEKMLIVFDSLSGETVQALQTVLKERFDDLERHFEWKTTADNQSLSEFLVQNPQTAMVFTTDNRSLFESRDAFIRHSPEVFNKLPSTFENSVFARGKGDFYAFPLLINPIKLSYANRSGNDQGKEHLRLSAIEDIENLCKAVIHREPFPLICSGGDDEQLFAFISAVAAMLSVEPAPDEFAPLEETMDLHTVCPTSLKTVLDKLVFWRTQGFLHPEWFRLIKTDIEIFMQFKSTALVCMPFSASRRLSRAVHEDFTTLQIPLTTILEKKNMAADIIVYAQTVQKAEVPAVDAIRQFLYLQETNEILARHTGFSPVFSSAQTQDMDASSGRYWVAASNKALPFFGNLVCTTAESKKQLAAEIRRYLEVNGIGYGAH